MLTNFVNVNPEVTAIRKYQMYVWWMVNQYILNQQSKSRGSDNQIFS